MDNHTSKRRNNTNDDDSKKLPPKCLVALFLTFNFVWGLDFGFIKYFDRKHQKTLQFVSFLIKIFTFTIIIEPVRHLTIEPAYALWQLLFVFQYIIILVILNGTKYTLYDFLIDVSEIGLEMSNLSGFIMIVYLSSITLIKHVLFVLSFLIQTSEERKSLLLVPPTVGAIWYFTNDLVPFAMIVIHYHIFLYLKNLKESIHDVKFDLKYVVDLYEAIADSYDKIMPLYDNIVSMHIISEKLNM